MRLVDNDILGANNKEKCVSDREFERALPGMIIYPYLSDIPPCIAPDFSREFESVLTPSQAPIMWMDREGGKPLPRYSGEWWKSCRI